MIWLFHRRGEYLACEVRTCLENSGFELLMTGDGRKRREWYSEASQIERRWDQVRDLLDQDGWGDVYALAERPLQRKSPGLRVVRQGPQRRSAVRD